MLHQNATRRAWAVLSATLLAGFLGATAPAADAPANDLLDRVEKVIAAGPFRAAWESLEAYRVPEWYLDAKFGIFIHWGVYSVPAFGNEWYPRNMYLKDSKEFQHHVATYGTHEKFGYKDFIPLFKAESYDPEAWAELFRASGARFVVPVAEHHDGFAMYDCSLSDWCAAKMGPKRDLIGELAAAVQKQGLTFGLSTHRAEHWWFFNGAMAFESDVKDPKYAGLYAPAQPEDAPPSAEFLDDWFLRTCELVEKYQPKLVWFDWWIERPAFKPYLERFAAFYYNRAAEWGRGVAINYKKEAFPEKTAVLDIERGQLEEIRPSFWQTDTSIAKGSWGYVKEQDYKTAASLIGDLVDIVSKNGALLLNIGPRPDGTIPEKEREILLEIGKWLAVNGPAIYETRPWIRFGEGPTKVVGGSFNDTKREAFTSQDLRFTTKGNVLYAIVLGWSEGPLTIRSLGTEAGLAGGEVQAVRLLGHEAKLAFVRDAKGLTVRLPETKPCDHAYSLEILGLSWEKR